MSAEQLVIDLTELQAYEIESHGIRCQFEVQMLENKRDHVHVLVSVDDGRLPYSISPMCQDFTQKKVQQRP